MAIIPPYLKPGDTIGLVCPAGFMPAEKYQTCIETLIRWGFKVVVGKTPGHQFHYFSGTDEERLKDLQHMMTKTLRRFFAHAADMEPEELLTN
jgi:muramoyltetrapeptide carboxypeptidase